MLARAYSFGELVFSYGHPDKEIICGVRIKNFYHKLQAIHFVTTIFGFEIFWFWNRQQIPQLKRMKTSPLLPKLATTSLDDSVGLSTKNRKSQIIRTKHIFAAISQVFMPIATSRWSTILPNRDHLGQVRDAAFSDVTAQLLQFIFRHLGQEIGQTIVRSFLWKFKATSDTITASKCIFQTPRTRIVVRCANSSFFQMTQKIMSAIKCLVTHFDPAPDQHQLWRQTCLAQQIPQNRPESTCQNVLTQAKCNYDAIKRQNSTVF